MQDYGKILKEIVLKADSKLRELDAAREKAVKLSRDVIRLSGWSITALHQGNVEEARKYLDECESVTKELLRTVDPYPELSHSGLTYNAVSEYVEAKAFFSVVVEGKLPGFEELGVQVVPYLQGLGDVVGELRRHALESLRRGDVDEAWKALDVMEAIYESLRGLDYPDAILPNLRHKVDVARGLIDDTKAMLVELRSREELQSSINNLKSRLESEC